jgi:hypothetical protein
MTIALARRYPARNSRRVLCAALLIPVVLVAQNEPPFAARGFRQVMSIGEAPSTPDYAFARVGDLAVSPAGHIYVLDVRDAQVKIFDNAGKFVSKFGRKGGGQGDFMFPVSIGIEDSSVVVRDNGQVPRVLLFSLDGKHMLTRSVPAESSYTQTYVLHGGLKLIARRALTAGNSVANRSTPEHIVLVQKAGSRQSDTLAKVRSGTTQYPLGNGRTGSLPSGFGDGGAWAVSGDSLVALIDGYAGTVKWYVASAAGLELKRTARLGTTGAAVTPEDIAEREAEMSRGAVGLTGRGEHTSASEQIRMLNPPTQWSVASRAFFSVDGSLWVSGPPTRDKRTIVWTVFPPTGAPFLVNLPSGFTLRAVRGDDMFGVGVTKEGASVVVGLRLNPGG